MDNLLDTELGKNERRKKYYYMHLKKDFFGSFEIRYLESLENGWQYCWLFIKLCYLSFEGEGMLCHDGKTYTLEQLAFLNGLSLETMSEAMEVFKELEMVEQAESGKYYISNFWDYVGAVGQETMRKREYRARIAAEKQ